MGFFNKKTPAIVSLLTLTLSTCAAYADTNDWFEASNQQVDEMLESIDESVFEKDANKHMPEAKRHAEAIKQKDPQQQRLEAQKEAQQHYDSHDTFIFASQSLEHEGLQDMLEVASEDQKILIVFRGVPEGMKIDEGMRELQKMAAELDPVPSVSLDPTLFDRYDVNVVPTIVKLAPSGDVSPADLPTAEELLEGDHAIIDEEEMAATTSHRKMLARVEGLTGPAWMERQQRQGRGGDLGREGPVAAIEEPDLIEVMKQRTLAIDWESQKQNALDNFWAKQRSSFQYLPSATSDKERRINAEVVVTENLDDGNGNIIARKGDRFNPMDMLPFTLGLVAIDPLDKIQIKIADQQIKKLEARDDINTVMVLVSRFDTDEGWDGYEELTDHFDRPVYLLPPDMVERFRLERLPSVITGDDTHFIVNEFAAALPDSHAVEE